MNGKFNALRAKIIADITAGNYPVGGRIPSRTQLVRRYGCSPSTVDRVIAALIAERRLAGRQGSGTTVLTPPSGHIDKLFITSYMRSGDLSGTVRERFFDGQECPVELQGIRETDVLFRMDRLSAPGAAVIWDCAEMDSLGAMRLLAQAGIPQLLINRQYHDYDSVATDQKSALRDALAWLLIESGREIALISYPATPQRPYLYERLIAFYEAAIELGARCNAGTVFCRDFQDLTGGLAEVGKTLFFGERPCRALAVMHHDLVLPLITCGLVYDKIPGRDYQLLSFDYLPELRHYHGICMLRQQFRHMYDEALHWLALRRDGNREPFRKQIRPELIIQ